MAGNVVGYGISFGEKEKEPTHLRGDSFFVRVIFFSLFCYFLYHQRMIIGISPFCQEGIQLFVI